MAKRPIIALDFDGVLAEYSGWQGEHHMGNPIPGALEFINANQSSYQFVIYTVRKPQRIIEWLQKNAFPYIPVTNTKPKASAYIDDRAIRFDGNWESVQTSLPFQPWWKG
ncbi:hypothetical protein ACQCN2_08205 [Brevibacillus ginsengisoli]|uniref:hypothetical protein n=1 Tax=Brevibacillus ginsengisoli TaxID=363854 RepID=UPI003CEFDB3A